MATKDAFPAGGATDIAVGCVMAAIGCLAIILRIALIVALIAAVYGGGRYFGVW